MLEPGRIEQDLIGLNSSGLTVADTPAPDEAFLFRHIMVRDVAYETLSFHLRQDLHEQLAAYLEQSSDALPIALIAYHYARSANSAKEAVYRRLAAELAIRNGAYGDARAHVQRASEIVARPTERPRQGGAGARARAVVGQHPARHRRAGIGPGQGDL